MGPPYCQQVHTSAERSPVTIWAGGADGDNGQLETPPELGAVDAVLNLSRDKWLKPSPAYNRVRGNVSLPVHSEPA